MSDMLRDALPDVIGASVGALLAGMIAIGVAWLQRRTDRRLNVEAARRNAYGEVLVDLTRVQMAARVDEKAVAAANVALVDSVARWRMFMASADAAEVARGIRTLIIEFSECSLAEARHRSPSMARLREPGSKSRELIDTIDVVGARWHAGNDVRAAAREIVDLAKSYPESWELTS